MSPGKLKTERLRQSSSNPLALSVSRLAMEEAVVRLRVVFEDRHILSKAQRSEGLKCCWLLLRPSIASISDLASHLSSCFDLQHSCPHGLVLSMDGFVLPPFLSTCIFMDKEVIRVKKKEAKLKNVLKIGADEHGIQDVEGEPMNLSGKILASRNLHEESTVYEGPTEEDADENGIFIASPLVDNTGSKRKRRHSDKPKHDEVEENCKRLVHQPHTSNGMKKCPSRNARRKKAKRQLHRSQNKVHPLREVAMASTCRISVEGQILNQDMDGHICCGPEEKRPSTFWEQAEADKDEQNEAAKDDGWSKWPRKGGFTTQKDSSGIINSWLNGAWGESASHLSNQDGWTTWPTNVSSNTPSAYRARRRRALPSKITFGKVMNWKTGKFGPSK